MIKQPIECMFSPYRRSLLATLLLRPGERFHVRELERMTGISAGPLHRELKSMAQSGMLLRERAGHQVLYRADTDCPIYDELAAIFRKTVGMLSLLQDALLNLVDNVEVAFVFESMASGEQHSGSDLDICVLGDATLMEVVKALSTAQEQLQCEMNPVVMTTKIFQTSRSNRTAL